MIAKQNDETSMEGLEICKPDGVSAALPRRRYPSREKLLRRIGGLLTFIDENRIIQSGFYLVQIIERTRCW